MTAYRHAPEVRDIAEQIISDIERHQPLAAARIIYLFRDKAPKSKGRIVLGRARMISGLAAFLLNGSGDTELFEDPRPLFVVEISHNTWLELDDAKRFSLVDHELCHLAVDLDCDDPALSTRGHDYEEFAEILMRHGLWSTGSVRVAQAIAEQLSFAIDDISDYVGNLGTTSGGDTDE